MKINNKESKFRLISYLETLILLDRQQVEFRSEDDKD